jgi:hypothetical protein
MRLKRFDSSDAPSVAVSHVLRAPAHRPKQRLRLDSPRSVEINRLVGAECPESRWQTALRPDT